jgi:gamma-glutamylcyclotransferase (GGCT)/AIG2-like uncharacterized protein YtfP
MGLYFAYGSNINRGQMAQRCPDAQPVGIARLEGYELLFRGNDRGAGVATIVPQKGGEVRGLLWRLTPQCELSLDRYEGYPRLYKKETVTVRTHDGWEIPVMTYVMTREWIRDPVLPSKEYSATIREGYRQNGLPVKALDVALKHARSEVREWQAIFSDDWPILNLVHQTKRKRGTHER